MSHRSIYGATCVLFVLGIPAVEALADECPRGQRLQGACREAAARANPGEITLFGSDGSAVAYVAEDLTIHLWSGDPVAYLESDNSGGFHIFGFNGKHLGWYVSGIVRDHGGLAVGARRESFGSPVQAEPFKGFKKFKPFKAFKEFAPLKPAFVNTWSPVSLDEFLMQGKV